MNKKDLQTILIEQCEYSERKVKGMAPREMVDAWLRYNGIVYYTDSILDVVGAAYDIDFEEFDIRMERYGCI